MGNKRICPVCGNEIDMTDRVCPWCETEIKAAKSERRKKEFLRKVNIKIGLPAIETARSRLISALYGAKADGVTVLKIVHGWGSSGSGGDIRFMVREYLEREKYGPLFKEYILGEDFSSNSAAALKIVERYTVLKKDADWKRKNKGITLVILR